MTAELRQAVLAIWAGRHLPARLDVVATAKLLGFVEHDNPVMMAAGRLTPLAEPAPNAPKSFAAVEVVQLATDRDWLHEATVEISKRWRNKRKHCQSTLNIYRSSKPHTCSSLHILRLNED